MPADQPAGGKAGPRSVHEKGESRDFTMNDRGEWMPAIPEPLYSLGTKCPQCGNRSLTRRRYREHFALAHVLGLSR